MATTEATLYNVESGAAWIRLNRPENRNALSAILVSELYDHLGEANEDPEVRCIVVTGNGSAFCAGADLKSAPGSSIEGRRSVPYPDVLKRIPRQRQACNRCRKRLRVCRWFRFGGCSGHRSY